MPFVLCHLGPRCCCTSRRSRCNHQQLDRQLDRQHFAWMSACQSAVRFRRHARFSSPLRLNHRGIGEFESDLQESWSCQMRLHMIPISRSPSQEVRRIRNRVQRRIRSRFTRSDMSCSCRRFVTRSDMSCSCSGRRFVTRSELQRQRRRIVAARCALVIISAGFWKRRLKTFMLFSWTIWKDIAPNIINLGQYDPQVKELLKFSTKYLVSLWFSMSRKFWQNQQRAPSIAFWLFIAVRFFQS